MIAAEKVTPEAINFMATHGRGLICLAMTGQRLDELHIPLMVSDHGNTSQYETAFCVSIEAKRNVSTGISAFDRAQTILTAIDPKTRPSDLTRPGHIFPLRARDGGVLVRAGQTEASVDLAVSRRHDAGGSYLRDHERRRHDGACARSRGLRAAAQPEDHHDGGFDSVSPSHGAVHPEGRRNRSTHAPWKLPHDRLREHARPGKSHRISERQYRKRRRRVSPRSNTLFDRPCLWFDLPVIATSKWIARWK